MRWAWGRVLGEAAEWCPADVAAASSCSVSLWRSFNPDVLHGAAKCMRLILASACQSTELLLLGCELRRDMQCWGWKAAASHRVWQDHTDRLAASDMSLGVLQPIAGPGEPAVLVGANHLPTSLCLILSPGLSLL